MHMSHAVSKRKVTHGPQPDLPFNDLSQTPAEAADHGHLQCYQCAFAGTNLYSLVTEAHRCELAAQSSYMMATCHFVKSLE